MYMLVNKSKVYDKFLLFMTNSCFLKLWLRLNSQLKLKFLDQMGEGGGGEYTSKAFESFLSSNGIMHQIACLYTPQHNGLVERNHIHLIETTITLLS